MAEDNSWVFDSLVCFLHGPVWNAPLQTFIEEKSLIFDPNLQPNESTPEYSKIHDDYKNLVDYMLGSFMEEMQITPEQFELACLEGRNQHQQPDNPFSFHQGLFQQIWAANDIKIFIRMMKQRNVELQLQALDLIERRQNSASTDDEKSTERAAIGESKSSASDIPNDDDESVVKEIEKSVEKEFTETPPPILQAEVEINHGKISVPECTDKFERLNLFFEDNISPEEIKSRQEYLRSQRDKILAIKKRARARQLNENTKQIGRPSSAQVAQKILDGKTLNEDIPNSSENSASFQLRKTLAQRLRNEVVENRGE